VCFFDENEQSRNNFEGLVFVRYILVFSVVDARPASSFTSSLFGGFVFETRERGDRSVDFKQGKEWTGLKFGRVLRNALKQIMAVFYSNKTELCYVQYG
jgi:hypothetical protein